MSTHLPDRDPSHLYPAFAAKVSRVVDGLNKWCKVHAPEFEPIFGEGFRSTARQQELYAQGRTTPGPKVTEKNGLGNKSNHQSALAFDLWLKKDGKIAWDAPKALWDYYGHLCRAEGLTWGGDWKSLVDQPHCEWPIIEKSVYTSAREWLKLKGLK